VESGAAQGLVGDRERLRIERREELVALLIEAPGELVRSARPLA
jgi:hypothetical protein